MASNKEKIRFLYLFLVIFMYLGATTGINIDCDGKPFHCINSTHFMICVDLGGGISKTVDNYVIQCPLTTVCRKSNHFECEYQISTTAASTIRLGDETNEFQTNLQVTTVSPLQKSNFNTFSVTTQAKFVTSAHTEQQNTNMRSFTNEVNSPDVLTTKAYEVQNLLTNTQKTNLTHNNNSHGLLKLPKDEELFQEPTTPAFSTQSAQVASKFMLDEKSSISTTYNLHNEDTHNSEISDVLDGNTSQSATSLDISLDTTTESFTKNVSYNFSERVPNSNIKNMVPTASTSSYLMTTTDGIVKINASYESTTELKKTTNDEIVISTHLSSQDLSINKILSEDVHEMTTTSSNYPTNSTRIKNLTSEQYLTEPNTQVTEAQHNLNTDNRTKITSINNEKTNTITDLLKRNNSLFATLTDIPLLGTISDSTVKNFSYDISDYVSNSNIANTKPTLSTFSYLMTSTDDINKINTSFESSTEAKKTARDEVVISTQLSSPELSIDKISSEIIRQITKKNYFLNTPRIKNLSESHVTESNIQETEATRTLSFDNETEVNPSLSRHLYNGSIINNSEVLKINNSLLNTLFEIFTDISFLDTTTESISKNLSNDEFSEHVANSDIVKTTPTISSLFYFMATTNGMTKTNTSFDSSTEATKTTLDEIMQISPQDLVINKTSLEDVHQIITTKYNYLNTSSMVKNMTPELYVTESSKHITEAEQNLSTINGAEINTSIYNKRTINNTDLLNRNNSLFGTFTNIFLDTTTVSISKNLSNGVTEYDANPNIINNTPKISTLSYLTAITDGIIKINTSLESATETTKTIHDENKLSAQLSSQDLSINKTLSEGVNEITTNYYYINASIIKNLTTPALYVTESNTQAISSLSTNNKIENTQKASLQDLLLLNTTLLLGPKYIFNNSRPTTKAIKNSTISAYETENSTNINIKDNLGFISEIQTVTELPIDVRISSMESTLTPIYLDTNNQTTETFEGLSNTQKAYLTSNSVAKEITLTVSNNLPSRTEPKSKTTTMTKGDSKHIFADLLTNTKSLNRTFIDFTNAMSKTTSDAIIKNTSLFSHYFSPVSTIPEKNHNIITENYYSLGAYARTESSDLDTSSGTKILNTAVKNSEQNQEEEMGTERTLSSGNAKEINTLLLQNQNVSNWIFLNLTMKPDLLNISSSTSVNLITVMDKPPVELIQNGTFSKQVMENNTVLNNDSTYTHMFFNESKSATENLPKVSGTLLDSRLPTTDRIIIKTPNNIPKLNINIITENDYSLDAYARTESSDQDTSSGTKILNTAVKNSEQNQEEEIGTERTLSFGNAKEINTLLLQNQNVSNSIFLNLTMKPDLLNISSSTSVNSITVMDKPPIELIENGTFSKQVMENNTVLNNDSTYIHMSLNKSKSAKENLSKVSSTLLDSRLPTNDRIVIKTPNNIPKLNINIITENYYSLDAYARTESSDQDTSSGTKILNTAVKNSEQNQEEEMGTEKTLSSDNAKEINTLLLQNQNVSNSIFLNLTIKPDLLNISSSTSVNSITVTDKPPIELIENSTFSKQVMENNTVLNNDSTYTHMSLNESKSAIENLPKVSGTLLDSRLPNIDKIVIKTPNNISKLNITVKQIAFEIDTQGYNNLLNNATDTINSSKLFNDSLYNDNYNTSKHLLGTIETVSIPNYIINTANKTIINVEPVTLPKNMEDKHKNGILSTTIAINDVMQGQTGRTIPYTEVFDTFVADTVSNTDNDILSVIEPNLETLTSEYDFVTQSELSEIIETKPNQSFINKESSIKKVKARKSGTIDTTNVDVNLSLQNKIPQSISNKAGFLPEVSIKSVTSNNVQIPIILAFQRFTTEEGMNSINQNIDQARTVITGKIKHTQQSNKNEIAFEEDLKSNFYSDEPTEFISESFVSNFITEPYISNTITETPITDGTVKYGQNEKIITSINKDIRIDKPKVINEDITKNEKWNTQTSLVLEVSEEKQSNKATEGNARYTTIDLIKETLTSPLNWNKSIRNLSSMRQSTQPNNIISVNINEQQIKINNLTKMKTTKMEPAVSEPSTNSFTSESHLEETFYYDGQQNINSAMTKKSTKVENTTYDVLSKVKPSDKTIHNVFSGTLTTKPTPTLSYIIKLNQNSTEIQNITRTIIPRELNVFNNISNYILNQSSNSFTIGTSNAKNYHQPLNDAVLESVTIFNATKAQLSVISNVGSTHATKIILFENTDKSPNSTSSEVLNATKSHEVFSYLSGTTTSITAKVQSFNLSKKTHNNNALNNSHDINETKVNISKSDLYKNNTMPKNTPNVEKSDNTFKSNSSTKLFDSKKDFFMTRQKLDLKKDKENLNLNIPVKEMLPKLFSTTTYIESPTKVSAIESISITQDNVKNRDILYTKKLQVNESEAKGVELASWNEKLFVTPTRPAIPNNSEINKKLLKRTTPALPNIAKNKLLDIVGQRNNNTFCINRLRGRYADKNDCRKFYICIGKIHHVQGECPIHTVFSEIKKQCTKNLSHCMINNQFHCIQEGRFSDVLKSNIYYICVKNKNSYLRFKFQCQSGYHLNKTSVRCIKDQVNQQQKYSISIDSESNKASDQSTQERKATEQKKTEIDAEKYICKHEGKFPNPDDCRKYFVCSKKSKSVFRRRTKKCDSDEVFHREKKKCVSDESYECK